MGESISFNISPKVLEWARVSMGYSLEQAAKKAGVPIDRYEAWETGQKLPTYKQLESLAENVYKRSLAILLLPEPPQEDPIQKDFRNLSNSDIQNLSPNMRLALRKAKRYQLILEEIVDLKETPKFKLFKVDQKDNAETSAQKFRDFLNLSLDEQKQWRYDDAFRHFKKKIESIGIYVFQLKLPIEEARAFCLTGEFPIVVLNTDDSKNARIFSLFHEVCHILFNTNDVFKDKTGKLTSEYEMIENFCNQFAASLLVPIKSFQNDLKSNGFVKGKIIDSQIQSLARSYNVSNEVIARKLLLLQYISDDFFWTRKRMWDAAAKAQKQKENEKLKDNESGINQGIKIVYQKGEPYVQNVLSAYNDGKISSSDVTNYLETKLTNIPNIIARLNS